LLKVFAEYLQSSSILISGKEKELLAIQVGGNTLINGLFEATLSDKQSSAVKPDNHTDLDLRSKFIYDKYQNRKWYSEDAYKKLKLREKADMALQKHKAKPAERATEEDFFAARTAKKGSPGCERFVMKENVENEWWKADELKSRRHYVVSSGSEASSQDTNLLGDRRNLLSNLQMESKSKLLSDLAELGINNDSRTLPSQIKAKVSRFKRTTRRNGLIRVPKDDRPHLTRNEPSGSKSTAASLSGRESSRSEQNYPLSPQLNKKNTPVKAVNSLLVTGKGRVSDPLMYPLTLERLKTSSDRIEDESATSLENPRRKKGHHRSRSSSVKRRSGGATNNRKLVSSLYDGSLMDSIAIGLATVDKTDDHLITRSSRRRLVDDDSQTSNRRRDEKSLVTHSSGKSFPLEGASHVSTTGRRPTSDRRLRSPNRRKGSVSRTPSPDLTQNSRRRVIDTPPRTQIEGAPIEVKRVSKKKSRDHSRPSKTQEKG
jgi:hypothetical protein